MIQFVTPCSIHVIEKRGDWMVHTRVLPLRYPRQSLMLQLQPSSSRSMNVNWPFALHVWSQSVPIETCITAVISFYTTIHHTRLVPTSALTLSPIGRCTSIRGTTPASTSPHSPCTGCGRWEGCRTHMNYGRSMKSWCKKRMRPSDFRIYPLSVSSLQRSVCLGNNGS